MANVARANVSAEGVDYSDVTEVPGNQLTRDGFAMMYARYAYAAGFCDGKRVLEVACGAGCGLAYLAHYAKQLVGADITPALLSVARSNLKASASLVRLDGQRLPFRPEMFDIVLLFEAVYYLERPEQFFAECRRVLAPGGTLVLSTVNREWREFNPSPLSVRYLAGSELRSLATRAGFAADLLGAFPIVQRSPKDCILSLIKRAAVRQRLMPKTMRGKAFLKRVFFGRLVTLGTRIEDGLVKYVPPVPLASDARITDYRILYLVARVR